MITTIWPCFPVVILLLAVTNAGCGRHPYDLRSARDIRRASPDLEQIRIGLLPLGDYPELLRFQRVKDIDFFTSDGTGSDNERLEALSKLELPRLEQLSLLNCSAVTDAGINFISKISSLRGLQLEGTAITDEAAAVMALKMKLTGVNLANCKKVTLNGLLQFAASRSIKEISFSVNELTQDDVIKLLNELKSVKWFGIVDPNSKLDVSALNSLAKAKGIAVNVSRTGALQDAMTNQRR